MSCKRLATTDPEFQAQAKRFRSSWNPGKWGPDFAHLPAPDVEGVWKVETSRPDYAAKKEALRSIPAEAGAGVGNEHELYHGTSLDCAGTFAGSPCTSTTCGICGILKSSGKFLLSKVGSRNRVCFGPGIYLTSGSHTAKGYGGKHRGARLDGFHLGNDGNAIVVCSVLMGKVEAHEMPASRAPPPNRLTTLLPPGFHSRKITKSGTRNDEQVLFSEDQVLPKYIITFCS